jgi:hypothetical protein
MVLYKPVLGAGKLTFWSERCACAALMRCCANVVATINGIFLSHPFSLTL